MDVLKTKSFYDTRLVKIQILQFNRIKIQRTIKFEDFKSVLRQNFLSPFNIWILVLYEKNEIIYKQKERYGWRYKSLAHMDKIAGSLK